jgi:hypothetical protein
MISEGRAAVSAAAATTNVITILPTPDQVRVASRLSRPSQKIPPGHTGPRTIPPFDVPTRTVCRWPIVPWLHFAWRGRLKLSKLLHHLVVYLHLVVQLLAATSAAANAALKPPPAQYYYYECLVLPGPTAREITDALPPNARLGPKLQDQLQRALQHKKHVQQEQEREQAKKRKLNAVGDSTSTTVNMDISKDNAVTVTTNTTTNTAKTVGGHVRLGWSMRMGDLQAPVGYDKWLYAVRDVGGSIFARFAPTR